MKNNDRPKKLLIYLDQNFISDMAKLGQNDRVRPEIKTLYDIIHKGFMDEKCVVLRSVFHEEETSIFNSLKELIPKCQSTLGHVSLKPPFHIEECQITRAIHKFFERPTASEIINYDDPFKTWPDDRVTQFDFYEDPSWQYANAQEHREGLAADWDQLRKRIQKQNITFDQQFAIELDGCRQVLIEPKYLKILAGIRNVTAEEINEFVKSDEFNHIPIIRLQAALMAQLFTAHSNRTISRGDNTDISAMATYLPYCNVYATDRPFANLARSINVQHNYDCELFNSSTKDILRFIDYLTKKLDEIIPVNIPAFTIIVLSDKNIKDHSFDFFHKLGTQKWLGKSVQLL